MRHVKLLVLATALLSACGDDGSPPPPDPTDTGRRDAGTPAGDGGMDGAMPEDAGGDAGEPFDAGDFDAGEPFDAGDFDAGEPFDAGDFDAGEPFDAGDFDAGRPVDAGSSDSGSTCDVVPGGRTCSDTMLCPTGFACIDNGCGEMRCLLAGHPCGTRADCPTGSDCVETADGDSLCQRATGCADSRDCPVGFACEAGECADRRIRCNFPETVCPYGFICIDVDLGTFPFCFKYQTRCSSDDACTLRPGSCVDVDGDGASECQIPGLCTTSETCGDRMVCGIHPDFMMAGCDRHGPCTAAGDCPSGWSCADLWGDGLRECVPPGGSCTSTADCPGTGVCASPSAGMPAECISRPL